MSGRVRFDPPVMIRSAGRLDAIAEDLGRAASAVRSVPTGGLPPQFASSARIVLSEAGCDLGTAQATTGRAADEIVARAVRALALDDGCGANDLSATVRRLRKVLGDSGRDIGKNLGTPPSEWDYAGFLNSLRREGRKWLTETRRDLGRTRKLKWAQQYWDENAWVRRSFKSAKDLQKHANRTFGKEIRGLEKTTRLLDRLDPAGNLPKGLRRSPLAKAIPGLGDALAFAGALDEGRKVPDAAGKAATQAAVSAGGAMVGGAVCGGATVATFGLGAASCPLLITGGAIAGDIVGGAVYDPVVRPVANVVVGGGKKVVGFVGGLFK